MPLTRPTKSQTKSPRFFSGSIFRWPSIILVGLGILFQTSNVFAAVPADKIKAAYIYQLTKFVTWPDSPASADKTFTICVIGKEPIHDELKPLGQRKTKQQSIKIRYPNSARDTIGCNILYIARTEQHQLKTILEYSHKKPILTVSSLPHFTENGGIIGFVIINNKVRLEINRAPARHNNIKLSAKLLEVANVIRNNTQEENQP